MNKNLYVKVSSRKTTNSETNTVDETWEGTVSLPGLKPSKLVKKSDNTTGFTTRSGLTGAARNLAKSLGYEDVEFSDSTATKAKVAAKKKASK